MPEIPHSFAGIPFIPESSYVKEYQDLLLDALKAVHTYNGTESSYDHVVQQLITLEALNYEIPQTPIT